MQEKALRLPSLTIALVVIGYAMLRFAMNREYDGATWEQLYTLSAPLPFGHRVLIPILSYPLVDGLGLSIPQAYQLYEIFFGFGLFLSLRSALSPYAQDRAASFFSCLFFFALPLLFLLNYTWPVYYPYDTPAVFFTALVFAVLIREKWHLAVLVTAIAALNRETSIFFPILAFCLYAHRLPLPKLVGWMLAMWSAHFVVRIGISAALPLNPGEALQFQIGDTPRILNNLSWLLASPGNFIGLLASLAFIPVFWNLVRDWLPADLRRVQFVSLLMFILLAFVGNLYEPRIFGELSVILYIPLSLACWGWLTGQVWELGHSTGGVARQGEAISDRANR